MGMGNAFTAVADDAEAGFWNPAGLIQWHGVKIGGTTKTSDREGYTFDPKCIAYSYRDIGLFWGNKIAMRVDSGDTPDYTYYSFARKLSSYIAVGGSTKFKRKHPCDYYQFFGYAPGYDLGVLWKPNALISGGMLIQNMGESKHWVSVITVGFAHKFLKTSLISMDISTLFEDQIDFELHAGCEWWIKPWAALRAGVSDSCPTAGAGLKLSILRIDYSWIRNEKGSAYFLSGQLAF